MLSEFYLKVFILISVMNGFDLYQQNYQLNYSTNMQLGKKVDSHIIFKSLIVLENQTTFKLVTLSDEF